MKRAKIFFIILLFVVSGCAQYSVQEKINMLYSFKNENDFTYPDTNLSDEELLKKIAKDTFGYFYDIVDKKTNLPLDNIKYSPKKEIGSYTNVTNIGLYLISLIGGKHLGLISEEEVKLRIKKTIQTIKEVEKYNNQPYNYYDTIDLSIGREYISTVDNAWLSAGLIIVKNTYPEFRTEINNILKGMDFGFLYDKKIKQLYLGYKKDENKFSEYHYGILNSESRIATYIGIMKNDLTEESWYGIYRTLPAERDWQNQKPSGKKRKYGEYEIFQGYYKHNNIKYLPTWGGSMFEAFMPLMIVNEMSYAKKSFTINHKNILKLHILYSKENNYPVFGLSPCFSPDGEYREWGVKYTATSPYPDEGIITPHVSFLAMLVNKKQAMKNIRRILKDYENVYGPYGFYDSFNIKDKNVAKAYLCLNQAMIFIPIVNILKDNIIQKTFEKEKGFEKIKTILQKENFFD